MKRIDKLNNNQKIELMFDLINAFSIVKNPTDTAFFLQDVLTANEIRNVAVRLRIAKLLLNGRTYEEIVKETKTSSATITKVNAWLERGGEGFRKVITKLPLKYHYPQKLSRGPIEFHLPEAIFKTIQYATASSQNKRLKRFQQNVKDKAVFDKQFKKIAGETYRKHH